jgi:hypothetical protein
VGHPPSNPHPAPAPFFCARERGPSPTRHAIQICIIACNLHRRCAKNRPSMTTSGSSSLAGFRESPNKPCPSTSNILPCPPGPAGGPAGSSSRPVGGGQHNVCTQNSHPYTTALPINSASAAVPVLACRLAPSLARFLRDILSNLVLSCISLTCVCIYAHTFAFASIAAHVRWFYVIEGGIHRIIHPCHTSPSAAAPILNGHAHLPRDTVHRRPSRCQGTPHVLCICDGRCRLAGGCTHRARST